MKHNVISSGYIAATTQIVAAPGGQKYGAAGGMIHAVELLPDGSNASSVVIYNAGSNTSGTEVAVLSIAASTTAPQSIVFNNPVMCPGGIRAVLGGTGGNVIVYYSLGS